MKTNLHKLLLTSVVVIVSNSAWVSADTDLKKDIENQNVSDARMETKIATTFALSPYLRASEIQVAVKDHKATLTGKIDEDVNKDLAKQFALGVEGVKSVDNKIMVIPGYTPPSNPEGNSFGQYIEDASITAAVKSKLLWSKHAEGFATDVDTKYGKVSLTGTAESPAAKELAGRLAMNTHGVISVKNLLTIEPNKATADSAKESEQPIADTWITTKVKSTLMYSSNVNGSNISVDTKNGIVNLSGKVDSGAERELAVELAENVRGVKSIDASKLK